MASRDRKRPSFKSSHLTQLFRAGTIHVISPTTEAISDSSSSVPLILLHGLGSSSSFWIAPLRTLSGEEIIRNRTVFAYDFDGHGSSAWSGRTHLSIQDLVDDLENLLNTLKIDKVIIGAHSMSAIVASLFAMQHPDRVKKLFLLNPVRNLSQDAQQAMRTRASNFIDSPSDVASAVSTTAISPHTLSSSPTTSAFIHHLVLSTDPAAYAAACIALAEAPRVSLAGLAGHLELRIVGGSDDYLTDAEKIREWADEMDDVSGKSTWTIIENVGHWAALEDPECVAKELSDFLG